MVSKMDGLPIRYTYPAKYRTLGCLCLVICSVFGALAAGAGQFGLASVCALGFLCFAALVVMNSESIRVDVDGVTYHRLWRADVFLAWDEIAALRAQDLDAGVRLEGAGRDRRIYFNARLYGYSDLVEHLLRRRPDLFRRSRFRLIAAIHFGSISLILLFLTLALSALAKGDTDSLLGFGVLAAAMAWIYLSRPLSLDLDPEGVAVRVGLVRRKIPLDDILAVRLQAEQSRRTSRLPGVELVLSGGKTITLTSFAGGEAFLYGSLQLWLEEQAADRLAAGNNKRAVS